MNNEYFLSINEVSKRLDLPAYTLRYWEKQFPVKVKPTTGAGGRRYYRPETVDALYVIKDLLYVRGMTIAGVKKIIKDGDFDKEQPEKSQTISRKSSDNSHPFWGGVSPSGRQGGAEIGDRAILNTNRLFSNSDDIATAIDLLQRAKAALQ